MGEKKRISAREIAVIGILSAIALITFMIENAFPPLFVVGAKIGISNIVTLFTLYAVNMTAGYIVLLVKIVIGSMFGGGVSSLIYSLTAGLIAFSVCVVLKKIYKNRISVVSISVLCAVIHNITQCVVFSLITKTPEVMSYSIPLSLIGVFSGLVVGIATVLLLNSKVREKVFL